jgi:hypothetical protein
MSFVTEVIIVDDVVPNYLGASCSGSVFSAPVVSVSMSEVVRGVKKLQVNIAFGGRLTAADVGTLR